MHFVLSYDLGATGTRRTQIQQDLDNILQPYRWARRLSTFYIIEVHNTQDWDTILAQLQTLSRNITQRFNFVMSPIMHGGRYDGILGEGDWDHVNEVTT